MTNTYTQFVCIVVVIYRLLLYVYWALLIAQLVKNPSAMQMSVQFLGQEDLLEKGKATYSSILAWRIPWTV